MTRKTGAKSSPKNAPYLNVARIPAPKECYIMWLDVMGSAATMSRSLGKAANFIFKLHIAALEQGRGWSLRLYPMNDGVYIASDDFEGLKGFVAGLFERLNESLEAAGAEPEHRFLVRGAIAFGLVVEGRSLPPDASKTMGDHPQYRDSVVIGEPVAAAFHSEPLAPPFGIYVHESARRGSGPGGNAFLRPPFLRYWGKEQPQWVRDLKKQVDKYFDHCKSHQHELGYKSDRLALHKSLADEFFAPSQAPQDEPGF